MRLQYSYTWLGFMTPSVSGSMKRQTGKSISASTMSYTYCGDIVMPFDQSSRYRFTLSPALVAMSMLRRISAKCSSGDLPSCSRQCFSEPLQSRLMTLPPTSVIQLTDTPSSTNPRISMASSSFFFFAHEQILRTESFSPEDTRAEATSMRGTRSSRSMLRAILSFSEGEKLTPEVCSPSRRVVSKISMSIPMS